MVPGVLVRFVRFELLRFERVSSTLPGLFYLKTSREHALRTQIQILSQINRHKWDAAVISTSTGRATAVSGKHNFGFWVATIIEIILHVCVTRYTHFQMHNMRHCTQTWSALVHSTHMVARVPGLHPPGYAQMEE